MDLITGKGPSKRHEIFYLGESTVGAVRIDDYKYPLHRPARRLAGRKDPSGRALHHQPAPRSVRAHGLAEQRDERRGAAVLRLVQVPVLALRVRPGAGGEARQTFIEYPPMQKGASFNLDAVKAEIEAARAAMGK